MEKNPEKIDLEKIDLEDLKKVSGGIKSQEECYAECVAKNVPGDSRMAACIYWCLANG